MSRSEIELECERLLFDYGKKILGKNAGGLINKLYKLKGLAAAHLILKQAADKSDPREYVGAALKEKAKQDCAAIGEKILDWEWDGGKWKHIGA